MSTSQMMEIADLVVDAEVIDVTCEGSPVETDNTQVSSYVATLAVLSVVQGDTLQQVQIAFEKTQYFSPPPLCSVGDILHTPGDKGRFYLAQDMGGPTYSPVSWSAFEEADDSTPTSLPDCAVACHTGDVNEDDIVNILDVVSLVAHIMGEGTFSADPCVGDVSGDDEINVLDVVQIVSLILDET